MALILRLPQCSRRARNALMLLILARRGLLLGQPVSDVTINELNALGNKWTLKANEQFQQQQNA